MPLPKQLPHAKWAIAAAVFICASTYNLASNVIPNTAFFGGDTWEYQSLAANFSKGYGLKFGALLPYDGYQFDAHIHDGYLTAFDDFLALGEGGGEYDFHRTPGYPFLLGVTYYVFGIRPDIAMLIQMLSIVAIGALLPLLGELLLGARGFFAGIPAGILVSLLVAPGALSIMTETLISIACFLLLAAWVVFDRHRNPLSGVLLGLTLAFALLVKGSLIFIPPMFVAYLAIRSRRPEGGSSWSVASVLLGLLFPLMAYSAWASTRAGIPILITTQGRSILLDGHNEYSLESGVWSPQWRSDPNAFYSKALARQPDASAVSLVTRFYMEHPTYLPRQIARKVTRVDEDTRSFIQYASVNGFMALCFVYTVLLTTRAGRPPGIHPIVIFALVTFLVGTSVSFAGCLVGTIIAASVGLLNPAFRTVLRESFEHSGLVALSMTLFNFLLIVALVFDDSRFVWPVYFVLLLMAAYLAIRIAERTGLASFDDRSEPATEAAN